MKAALWLLALFFFAVAVTLGALYNSGYVLVVAPPYRIELSLNLLVAVLLALLFIAYFVVRLAVITIRLPTEVRDFRARQRHEKAHAAMMEGLRAYFEGRYAKAERASAAALEMGQSPEAVAINAVVAARSAHELRRYSQRDEFIGKAESSRVDETTLRVITHAELLLDERRPEEALKLLASLRATGDRQHTAALRLELKAQQLGRNWAAVLDLLGQLERRNALDMGVITQLRRHAYLEAFKSRTRDPRALKEYWQIFRSPIKRTANWLLPLRPHLQRSVIARQLIKLLSRAWMINGIPNWPSFTANIRRMTLSGKLNGQRDGSSGILTMLLSSWRLEGFVPIAGCGARLRTISRRACRWSPAIQPISPWRGCTRKLGGPSPQNIIMTKDYNLR